jgi:hypothetical protein
LVVTAQVNSAPASIWRKWRAPATLEGLAAETVELSPIWPYRLSPQQKASSNGVKPQV